MIFKALVTAFTTRRLVNQKAQLILVKPNWNEFSFKNKYQQRRISNRLF